MSRTNQTLTQQEAERRAASHHGYMLISEYQGYKGSRRADFFCPKHGYTQSALVRKVFQGMRLRCCNKEHMSEVAKRQMTDANPFKGRRHTIASREKMSAAKKAAPNHMRGKPRPDYLSAAVRKAITGVARSAETKAKLSAKSAERHRNLDHIILKAERGKTAGKQGIFYVVKVGDFLKFGSATTTMQYRLTRMRQKLGDSVTVELHCLVDDAGAYEAAMMRKYREHWSHGEYFTDFRGNLYAGE